MARVQAAALLLQDSSASLSRVCTEVPVPGYRDRDRNRSHPQAHAKHHWMSFMDHDRAVDSLGVLT